MTGGGGAIEDPLEGSGGLIDLATKGKRIKSWRGDRSLGAGCGEEKN